jgi:AcrR family transcriptional regulator
VKKARGRYHHGALAKAALEAAAREIDEHGHQGFTLERVTRRLGVTPAALYRHFASRDALLEAVIAGAFARFAAQMDEAARRHASSRELIVETGDAYVAFALENPGCFRLQFSRAGAALFPPDHFGIQLAYPELMQSALRQVLGDRADLRRAFLMLWSFAHGVASLLVEQVFSSEQTDAERRACGHELFVEYVAMLGTQTSVKAARSSARPSRSRR